MEEYMVQYKTDCTECDWFTYEIVFSVEDVVDILNKLSAGGLIHTVRVLQREVTEWKIVSF